MSGWQKLNNWPPIGERVKMAFGHKIYYGYLSITSSSEKSYPWVEPIVETDDRLISKWPDYWMKCSIPE